MNFFEQSSHRSICSLTRDEIFEKRNQVNKAAIEQLLDKLPSELREVLLSAEEEAMLWHYYHRKIPEICRYFKFPPTVTATAHWLLSRCSLGLSVLQYDPKHVMLAAILLATKLEGLHLTMDQYAAKIPNTDAELLIELEFVLLASLDYKVFFFSPNAALAGVLLELKTLSEGPLEDGPSWDSKWIAESSVLLDRICATDALLMYSPSCLALVSLLMILPEGKHKEALLQKIVPFTRLATSGEPLDDALLAVGNLMNDFSALDPEKIKAIDRRLLQIRKAPTINPGDK